MLKKWVALLYLVAATTSIPTPGSAEIEHARDLMEANKFEAAYHELWPAARSGNADAEELIGIMRWVLELSKIISALLIGICALR